MPNAKNGAKPKPAQKIPALIVFGRMHGSKINHAAFFVQQDVEAAKKAASDAGLSCLEVKDDADKKIASTLREGVINAQGRFSLSPASPKVMAELERLLKVATPEAGSSASANTSRETPSASISAALWNQLKPGALVLAAGFDDDDNLDGWWEAIIVRIDDGEFLVRWRDEPNLPLASRTREYIALLHPLLRGS